MMSKSGDCSGAKTERKTEWTWGSSDVKNWVRKLTESTRVNCSDVQKWQESERVKKWKKARVRKRVRKRGKKNWVRKLTESTRVNCSDVQKWRLQWFQNWEKLNELKDHVMWKTTYLEWPIGCKTVWISKRIKVKASIDLPSLPIWTEDNPSWMTDRWNRKNTGGQSPCDCIKVEEKKILCCVVWCISKLLSLKR